MPPAVKINRVKRILIVFAIVTVLVIVSTSGTKYGELPIPFILLPVWFAMYYSMLAIRSFSMYLSTTYQDFYKIQARNAVRRFGFGKSALRQIWPYTNDLLSSKVRPDIVELIKDPEYISSLEQMRVLIRTSMVIVVSEMVVYIFFGIVKLWK